MEAQTKATILHDIVQKMGAGGAEITTAAWLEFTKAQNDGYQTGPEIGEKVPDFSLPDQNGAMRSLRDLAGQMDCCWSLVAAPDGDPTAVTSSSSCSNLSPSSKARESTPRV